MALSTKHDPRRPFEHEGSYDALTSLLTHHAFRALVARRLAHGELAPTDDTTFALVYFNIENFKHYNQRYGFSAGDTLIRHVALSILEAFPDCIAGRFAADQFVVLARETEVEGGAHVVRRAFRREHKDSSIWLRAGYYLITAGDTDAGVVCDRAKLACDELRGRRDVFLRRYDDELQRHIMWRRYVLDHYEEALRNKWIQAWCQPIVRVATGETCDVEALARWIDPTEGVVPPSEFVPVLEDARVIHLMDLAIIRDVCAACNDLAMRGKPYLPVSFNLSRLDFELCDIVSEVTNILDEYGIPHSMIAVEVTESALMGNQEFLKDEIDRFRAQDIAVWMDDFGSGYSSLNVLKDYTFDLVKVDMGFLRGLEYGEQSRVMLSKVIDMTKELGLKTLVEGVETKEHYDFVRSLGCGRAQGWHFGKASPKPESIEGVKNETHPEAELLAKRSFYEQVGRINLMRPDPKASPDGHYLPCDTPASIIRLRQGRYEYLNSNSLYEWFLSDIGHGSIEESEAIINDPSNPRGAAFQKLAELCTASGGWERHLLAMGTHAIIIRMRRIAQLQEFGAIAFLSVIDDVIDTTVL